MLNQVLSGINGIIWHPAVIFFLFVVGIVFTIWNRLPQFRSLTQGVAILFGRHEKNDDPGAISHFQALSAALSATVGTGNIGGTALAIAIGGPGALFWMWMVGFLGMALKSMEVTISMMYRRVSGDSIQGGPMWVVRDGLGSGKFKPVAIVLSSLFCITLLIATFTGGLFFQAWNASNVTEQFFGIPASIVGIILAILVGMVILGGIRRIGTVASRIVPFMCGTYLIAGVYVIACHSGELPSLFGSIFRSAFSTSEARGAFIGGTFGSVFSIGMQQAFFSNEAGQGSSPIVHSAAKTDEPVREGLVAGLEPFIDTIVVCTITGLVILSSGVWNRAADEELSIVPRAASVDGQWQFESSTLSDKAAERWEPGESVFAIVESTTSDNRPSRQQLTGTVARKEASLQIEWQPVSSEFEPQWVDQGIYELYAGASLTALAFDQTQPGLGKWLVVMATWLFGLSTMISWSYYGEQGVQFLFGTRGVFPYRIVFCLLIVLSCLGLVQSQTELTHLANLGTGVMLWVNIPITLLFASLAIRAHRHYQSHQTSNTISGTEQSEGRDHE